MEPRYEIQAKVYHVRFYDRNPDHYSSSFQMFVDGGVGHIYGLNGIGFFKWAHLHLTKVMEETGITAMQFFMMDDSLAGLQKALKDVAVFELISTVESGGRKMHQVRIKRTQTEI